MERVRRGRGVLAAVLIGAGVFATAAAGAQAQQAQQAIDGAPSAPQRTAGAEKSLNSGMRVNDVPAACTRQAQSPQANRAQLDHARQDSAQMVLRVMGADESTPAAGSVDERSRESGRITECAPPVNVCDAGDTSAQMNEEQARQQQARMVLLQSEAGEGVVRCVIASPVCQAEGTARQTGEQQAQHTTRMKTEQQREDSRARRLAPASAAVNAPAESCTNAPLPGEGSQPGEGEATGATPRNTTPRTPAPAPTDSTAAPVTATPAAATAAQEPTAQEHAVNIATSAAPGPQAPAPHARTPRPVRTALAITTGAPKKTKVMKAFTYTIKVRNTSKVVARNVIVRDALPAGMIHLRTSPKATRKGRALTIKLGNLKPKATRTITVKVKFAANVRGTRTNIAVARAANAKPVKAKAKTRVIAPAKRVVKPAVTG